MQESRTLNSNALKEFLSQGDSIMKPLIAPYLFGFSDTWFLGIVAYKFLFEVLNI